jgi:hypothetical protein
LIDAAGIVVLRPDLCPNTACQSLHDRVRPYLPFLNGPANPTPTPPLTADPSDVKVSVPAGKSGSVQITLTNTTGAPMDWMATSTVPWLAFSPAKGTIPAGSSVLLTAKVSASSLKSGSYAASITVTYGKQALSIPVTVTVANG